MHTTTTLPGTPRVLQAPDGRAPIRRREDKRISRTERERIASLSYSRGQWICGGERSVRH